MPAVGPPSLSLMHLLLSRRFLPACFAWLAAVTAPGQTSSAPRDGQTATPSPVTVLVHGAAGGGWQFKQVAALMEAKGWRVYRPSLSGLGEHFLTATADIGLGTHIDDIVNLILFEELHDVVLDVIGANWSVWVPVPGQRRTPTVRNPLEIWENLSARK